MRLHNIEALKVRNRNERAERYLALKRHDKAVRSTHRADISISFHSRPNRSRVSHGLPYARRRVLK